MTRISHTIAAVLMLEATLALAVADEAAIKADIGAFLKNPDTKVRRQLVQRIESDPAYDRGKVSGWLHAAAAFEPLSPGRQWIDVPLLHGESRRVLLRIPADYDAKRPWPLICALHGMNGHAEDIIAPLEHLLGSEADSFVLAAPDSYWEVGIHDPNWPVAEHPRVWRQIRQKVHVDSDRVYLMGYSRGGHGTWTLGVLHADQFAGIMPIAGTLILPLGDALFETFLPNLANLPALGAWGANDIYGPDDKPSPDGGICGMNRKLRTAAEKLDLPLTAIELAGQGHGGVEPPPDEVRKLLAHRRRQYPKTVQHTFRHIYQGSAYWLEGHEWSGDHWGPVAPAAHMRPGENPYDPGDYRAAATRAFRQRLAELRGTIDGQTVRVQRRKVPAFTVWIGDGMIDWDHPVTLTVNDKKIFEDRLKPDLYVCLSQAARTGDFDRLRWAGLRVRHTSAAKPVTFETTFPDLNELLNPKK